MSHERIAIYMTIALAVIGLVYWSGMMEGRMEALEVRMQFIVTQIMELTGGAND